MMPMLLCCRSDFWTNESILSFPLQPTAFQVQAHPHLCCTSQGLLAFMCVLKAFTRCNFGASAQRPPWPGIFDLPETRFCMTNSVISTVSVSITSPLVLKLS